MVSLKDISIGLVITSVVIIPIFLFINDVAVTYNRPEITNAYSDVADSVITDANTMQNSIQSSQLTGTIIDTPLMIVTGGYQALLLVFGNVDRFNTIIGETITTMGLPSWTLYIYGIFVILIVFKILSILFRYEV